MGDPDQSSEFAFFAAGVLKADAGKLVYGWRNADVENLAKMCRGESSFPLFLESPLSSIHHDA